MSVGAGNGRRGGGDEGGESIWTYDSREGGGKESENKWRMVRGERFFFFKQKTAYEIEV